MLAIYNPETGEITDIKLNIVVGYLDMETRKIVPIVPQEEEPADDEEDENSAATLEEDLDADFAVDEPGVQA